MSQMRWTDRDLGWLRTHYPHTSARAAALVLGRTVHGLRAAARRYGCTHRPHRPGAAGDRILREKHAAGWLDPEIARELEVAVKTVFRWRTRLGLRSNSYNPRHRVRIAQAVRGWLSANEVCSLGEIKALHHRLAVVRSGWLEAHTLREVAILELLAGGPQVLGAIARTLDLAAGGSGNWTRTCLNRLMHRGLVVNRGRSPRGGTGPRAVYALAPGVTRPPRAASPPCGRRRAGSGVRRR